MIRNGSDPRPSQVAIDNILGYLFDAVVEAPPIRPPTGAEPQAPLYTRSEPSGSTRRARIATSASSGRPGCPAGHRGGRAWARSKRGVMLLGARRPGGSYCCGDGTVAI